MAGIQTDFYGAAAVTPGDGRPREIARILDKDDNGYFKDVYVYTQPSNVRQPIADQFANNLLTATATTTQEQGIIRIGGTTPTITIPTPTATTDDGKILTLLAVTAGVKTITAGTNKIYDSGSPALAADSGTNTQAGVAPTAHTNITLEGVGANVQLIACQGAWYVMPLLNGVNDVNGVGTPIIDY